MTDKTAQQYEDELREEGQQLALETIAITLVNLTAKIDHLMEQVGSTAEDVIFDEAAQTQHANLVKSVATRLIKIATLSVEATGVKADREKISKNVIAMMLEAADTKGHSLNDEDALTNKVFEGIFEDIEDAGPDALDDAALTQKVFADIVAENEGTDIGEHDTALDASRYTSTEVTDGTMSAIERMSKARRDEVGLLKGGAEEKRDSFAEAVKRRYEQDVALEGSDDDDLMTMFRTSRKKKDDAANTRFDGDNFIGLFFNPETLPETPEEFAEYDARAIEYFKNVTQFALKEGVIDEDLANQITVVLQGGTKFNQADVVGNGDITQKIVDQGQELSGFDVVATTPVAVSEAIIAAYSVSVARLRGAYVQAKLGELAAHMEDIRQTGPKF